jgi:hypothetical protein
MTQPQPFLLGQILSGHFGNIIDSIAAAVVFAILATIWHYLGHGIRQGWYRLLYTIRRYLTLRREILLWIDTDYGTVQQLADHVRKQLQALTAGNLRRARVHAMKLPREILQHPMRPSIVAAIILINTDVSKLSADDKVREQIQDRLLKYLGRGGGLVGCHDVIYRRARNDRLQQAFGGKIDGFSLLKEQPVEYVRNPDQANHPIVKALDEKFTLKDGEILATKGWRRDAQVLFLSTEEPEPHNLVVAQEYLKTGRLVWLNSCDHQDSICPSIGEPQTHFVTLLSASVQWVARC